MMPRRTRRPQATSRVIQIREQRRADQAEAEKVQEDRFGEPAAQSA
jgi:hypothetical protein